MQGKYHDPSPPSNPAIIQAKHWPRYTLPTPEKKIRNHFGFDGVKGREIVLVLEVFDCTHKWYRYWSLPLCTHFSQQSSREMRPPANLPPTARTHLTSSLTPGQGNCCHCRMESATKPPFNSCFGNWPIYGR